MKENSSDTIIALSSAIGAAGVSVIRISGDLSSEIIKKIFSAKQNTLSKENYKKLIYGKIIYNHELIDECLAVFFPKGSSFTGEDTVEINSHGNDLIIRKIIKAATSLGARIAEPGEFSKRAFLNGKLDLTQAEALADLISASSEQALKLAQEAYTGTISSSIFNIVENLRDILAEIEAGIDFPEEDISPESINKLTIKIKLEADKISKIAGSLNSGLIIKDGFRILLCGRPNAGKSSLLNSLLGKNRAIVSNISGTTRDLIEESASFSGYKFTICDSAGLRESTDTIEKIGIELAYEKLSWANLILFLHDASTEISSEEQQIISTIKEKNSNLWLINNKIDLANSITHTSTKAESLTIQNSYFKKSLNISCDKNLGLSELINTLVEEVQSLANQHNTSVVISNERQQINLLASFDYLNSAILTQEQNLPPEIVAGELRLALSQLAEITGQTSTEDILGRIFSKFCVGK